MKTGGKQKASEYQPLHLLKKPHLNKTLIIRHEFNSWEFRSSDTTEIILTLE